MKASSGYERRGLVPQLAATEAKLCGNCDKWFAARKRERVCDDCLPANMRLRRAAKYGRPKTRVSRTSAAAQRRYKIVVSDVLGLTFKCLRTDPRAASLECRVLAYELAARERLAKREQR